MATRGVNGAASGTLNERFIRCEGCRVNVPKEDMLALGKCTVCGRPYEAVVTADGKGTEVATVAFTGKVTIEQQAKRKRWAVLESKRGRTYYHNTETGEDRWDKPADLEADAVDDAFVPFKNDAIKKAVLREQMKLEATKMGVPTYVVAASQQQLQQEDEADDPFTRMVDRGGKSKSISQVNFDGSSSEKTKMPKQVVGHDDGAGQQELQETAVDGGKCVTM